MNKRQKTLKLMAEAAGLTAISFDNRQSRHYVRCEAENGNTSEFWLSSSSGMDPRAEQNEQARMKRFARENVAQAKAAPIIQPPQPQPKEKPAMPAAPRAAATIDITPKSKPEAQVLDLSPTEFLRLAMWLQSQDLTALSSMDVLVLESSKHMGRTVEEGSVRSALSELKKQEPAHWGEPTDPQAIIVREVGRLLKEFGMQPTDAFSKLAARLTP